ncbi:MAG TPA: DUF3500 domain-containing protein [Planctomycetota bacterium]|nr:DUF3500 domain-containing protein [Planctomycetota bacterium]
MTRSPFKTIATSLGAAAGLALMAVAALTVETPSRAAGDFTKVSEEMCAAATGLWKSLTPEQQAKAHFEFKDEERLNWHFIPRDRKGLPIKEMTADQKKLAIALLSTALSAKGLEKATTIMSIEQILAEMEGPNRKMPRDPELYYVSIFGTPEAKGVWGWRVEGHHVSINITLAGGKMIAATPAFLGSNPGEVKNGPRKGLRVLGNDEEMGRAIVKSLSDEQKAAAIFTKEAPKEVILVPKEKIRQLDPVGIAWAKLDSKQQEAVWTLIQEYANRLRGEFAERDLDRIEKAGRDKISFGWAGGLERGEPHYYRVQGPTFVVEYDNVQNGANHVHSVWHDPTSNFGEDILRAHHEAEHNNK